MLTPIFTISQSADALTVDIRCPYADIASTQVCINDDEFRFFSKPYFLRLHLPGRIVETGNEVVNYDFDKKEFRVQIAKETPGAMIFAYVHMLLLEGCCFSSLEMLSTDIFDELGFLCRNICWFSLVMHSNTSFDVFRRTLRGP